MANRETTPPGWRALRSDPLAAACVAAVLAYAAFAGLRTISDADLFWQLRDARYLVETGSIARHDVFSYTARSAPWSYPQGAGLIFYALHRAGGFAALSWFSMLACVATAAALLWIAPGIASAAIVGLAVPLIAWRTAPRAELFTTFLFALFLALLLKRDDVAARRQRWILPVLMIAWVNLHPGFVLGLGLLFLFFAASWRAGTALERGRTFVLALLATMLNPFGPAVWAIPWRQARAAELHRTVISEWWPSAWSWWRFQELLKWRDPGGAYWVLFFLGAALLLAALARREWIPAFLLIGFGVASLASMRFQAFFGIAVAAGAGAMLARTRSAPGKPVRGAATVLLVLLAALRIFDLATNRYYFSHPEEETFGAGLSYALPERAADFVAREKLPGQVLHDYGLGGFLSWEWRSQYPVFIDGRAIPFGKELVLDSLRGIRLSPGSPEWRSFLDRWGIQTLFLGLGRYHGYNVPLREMCDSPELRLVYLDEVTAVFLRNLPANALWIQRLAKNCGEAPIPPAPPGEPAYLHSVEASRLYQELGRFDESLAAIQVARRSFDADPELDLQAGRVYAQTGRPDEARSEFLKAIRLQPDSRAWFSLGVLDASQGRTRDAIEDYLRAVRTAQLPYEGYRAIGDSYLALRQPNDALRWFERALEARNSSSAAGFLPPQFFSSAYAGLARARFMIGDAGGAQQALDRAIRISPRDVNLYLMRADFFEAQGRPDLAREARARAEELASSAARTNADERR